ncbi:MAG: hypothetical protein DRQ88_13025 [Epsilonproteobacteria bacterium]|nr:MAG: hypothetical protein DRQ88_13025 [Campylobacterota bacterium]
MRNLDFRTDSIAFARFLRDNELPGFVEQSKAMYDEEANHGIMSDSLVDLAGEMRRFSCNSSHRLYVHAKDMYKRKYEQVNIACLKRYLWDELDNLLEDQWDNIPAKKEVLRMAEKEEKLRFWLSAGVVSEFMRSGKIPDENDYRPGVPMNKEYLMSREYQRWT